MHIPTPPGWFNPHGLKMSLGNHSICQVTYDNEVRIGTDVARLQIRPGIDAGKYQVLWQITHGPGEFVQGQILLSKTELEEAFWLRPNPPKNVFAEHINGDPNISVFVTDDLQDAVRKLINS